MAKVTKHKTQGSRATKHKNQSTKANTHQASQADASAIMNSRAMASRMLLSLLNTVRTQDSRALLSSWLSRELDINYECRWPTTITTADYKDMFERFSVAARVVSIWPEECWIQPPDIYENEDAKTETAFEQVWNDLVKTKYILSYLERVDILSRIGRYGGLLFGLSDLQENEKMSKPVEGVQINPDTGLIEGPRNLKLLYLKVFQEADLEITLRESNVSSPRYGMPIMYSVTMENPDGSTKVDKVHWTRMLHVVDNRLSSDILGEPAMKPVWNELLDLRKTKGAAAEGYWKAALSGFVWGLDKNLVDPNTTITSAQKEDFMDELDKMHNSLQHDIISLGLEPKDVAPKLIDPTPYTKMLIELICIKLRVPVSIFMGREEGQLAADENRTAWLERVKGRQDNYLTPMLIRPCVQQLQAYGVLPETQEFKTDWPDRNSPTEKDIAETAVNTTRAMSLYVSGGVNQLIGEKEYLGQVFKKTPDEIEVIGKEINDWEQMYSEPEPEPDDNTGTDVESNTNEPNQGVI